MTAAEFLDIIVSRLGRLVIRNPAGYPSSIGIGDLSDDDFITKGMAATAGASGARYFIAAGTAIPKNFTTTDIPQLKPNSLIQTQIPSPFPGAASLNNVIVNDMYIEPIFSTTGKDVVLSVNIYGHDDGAGLFAEDTWVLVLG